MEFDDTYCQSHAAIIDISNIQVNIGIILSKIGVDQAELSPILATFPIFYQILAILPEKQQLYHDIITTAM